MVKNVGPGDRVARVFIGALLCFLAFTTSVQGWLEIVFYAVGGYLVLTAALGVCLFYRLLDINSYEHGGEYHSGPDPFDGRV